jgi:hypothetical protein
MVLFLEISYVGAKLVIQMNLLATGYLVELYGFLPQYNDRNNFKINPTPSRIPSSIDINR